MSTTTEQPAWQRGYALDDLRAIERVFTEHDQGLPLSPFTRVRANQVAEWLADGDMLSLAGGEGYIVRRLMERRQQITGWNGEVITALEPGDVYVRRLGWSTEYGHDAVREWLRATAGERFQANAALVVEAWVEHAGQQEMLRRLSAQHIGTKIRASSELLGLYSLALQRPYHWPDAAEVRALSLLGGVPPATGLVAAGRAEVEAGIEWADHYSTYNLAHAWQAVGLTAYTPPGGTPDPQQIAKPAEMSRGWKAEHPDWPEWTLERTPLAARLPYVWRLLETLPGWPHEVHRVRLMRLTPGGGELSRHSDITDPDAGTRDGQFMRLHLPLITNPGVMFTQWLLDGTQVRLHMPAGRWAYIDTRKPHTARNDGEADRIHLVADVAADWRLRQALLDGRPAQP